MTVVTPYKRVPVAPVVCWLDSAGRVTSEDGDTVDLDDWPKDHRCWTDFDTVRQLLSDGRGESLCWIGDEIRWRHKRFEDGWKNRPSDVAVLKIPFPEDDSEYACGVLAQWRTWLEAYGASPTGTTGGAAWSLLRATLTDDLFTGAGWKGKPDRLLKQTLGARIENGPAGANTEHVGALEHWDLTAAYATELGNLTYGGRWHNVADLRAAGHDRGLDWWARGNRPVFVHAQVRIPADLAYGPLPKRPARRTIGLEALMHGVQYPTGGTIQGLWTWQEIAAAETHGCRLVKVLDTWVHIAGGAQPFLPWWEAIQAGRNMPGLAGVLAKITGNALWGRFCMDARAGGIRSIRAIDPKASKPDRVVFRSRRAPQTGGLPPSHDLAETVSGRVRAKLFLEMMGAGDRLISAHTDGFWSYAPDPLLARIHPKAIRSPEDRGWRMKGRARRLQLRNPQELRYWPNPPTEDEPRVVMAGVPARMAPEAFQRRWDAQLAAAAAAASKPRLGASADAWDAYRAGAA